MASSAADLDLEEWKECRTSIGRFDTIIAATRQFGFTLATGLVFALYLLDRYYWVLLGEAVRRAEFLEKHQLRQLHLTQLLSHISKTTWADRAALGVYIIFVIVAAVLLE